jgi:hypothetical protein
VDYLAEKLAAAKVGCTCPPVEPRGLPPGALVLTECVEHGQIHRRVGGFGWARA